MVYVEVYATFNTFVGLDPMWQVLESCFLLGEVRRQEITRFGIVVFRIGR